MIVIVSSITGSLCFLGGGAYLIRKYRKWKQKRKKITRNHNGISYQATMIQDTVSKPIDPAVQKKIAQEYEEEEKLCIMCLDKERNVIYHPCGCKVACYECAHKYEKFIYSQNAIKNEQNLPICIYCQSEYSQFQKIKPSDKPSTPPTDKEIPPVNPSPKNPVVA